MRVEPLPPGREGDWDAFVDAFPGAEFFHRVGWREVIQNSMGHRCVYAWALDGESVRGVLPLTILRTGLFGNLAVSLPFLNVAGVAADEEAARALAEYAASIGSENGCRYVEWRQRRPLGDEWPYSQRKVVSNIPLDGGEDAVFARLHQNVRNKIRKAEKNGVRVESGSDRLADFFRVYSHNLRDLGTPNLPLAFFREVLRVFPDHARVFAAYHDGALLGAKLIFLDRPFTYFVWSASYRKALSLAPVQALNWAAIAEACRHGSTHVDLGRSTDGSTHQNFKKYWGVEIEPMAWTYPYLPDGHMPGLNPDNPKFHLVVAIWKRLPVWLTRRISGPLARRLP